MKHWLNVYLIKPMCRT